MRGDTSKHFKPWMTSVSQTVKWVISVRHAGTAGFGPCVSGETRF